MSDDAGGTRIPRRPRTSSPDERETTIIRWPGKAFLAAAVGLSAALVALPTAALANAGTWGPDATPYRNGVVCEGGATDTALTSWTGADNGTAFGLSPIQSGFGHTDEPATSGIVIPVQASSSGLDRTRIAQLAYLVSAHGEDGSAGVIGDVAADVLTLAGTNSNSVGTCLASGIDGASAAEAATLLDEAERLTGPYTVNLTGPTSTTPAGKPIALVARVTSASGNPVPNLTVSFSPSGTGTHLSAVSVVTDSDGEAQVDAQTGTAGSSAPADAAAVTASVQIPVGLLETSAGGDVPLVGAAAPQQYSDRLALNVDTRPDPHLRLTNTRSLLLTGGQLGQSLTVTGMNGHLGRAIVSLYGPLTLASTGCGSHTAANWAAARAAHTVAETPQVAVSGDGSYPIEDATALSPGCYQAVAQLTTTDASPNVTARTTGDDVTVAPVTVAAEPEHSGIAPVGSLHTVLRATSALATSWQGVQGEVVGPRTASSGQCPTTGWDSASTVALVTSTGASTNSESDRQAAGSTTSSDSPSTTPSTAPAPAGSTASGDSTDTASSTVTVASSDVGAAGCYAFRLTATLQLPGLGTVPIELTPGTQDTPVHVIAPAVSVTKLSGSGVDSGGHLAATVDVASSDGQPGSLRLELLRLPYTFRGCFGADWSRASIVQTPRTPVRPTKGDNSYRVTTAAVPGSACWTVVPVFTVSANPAVRAQATPGDDPMLAFTSIIRPPSNRLTSAGARVGDGTGREIGVGVAAMAILLGLLLITLGAARRGRRITAIDPRDQLLGPSAG